MKPYRLISLLLVATAMLLLAGCVRPIQQASASATVNGSVTYNVRMVLPQDAVVTVQLRDASSGDMHGTVVNEQEIVMNGNQVPVAFEVPYTPAAINKDSAYILVAFIQDGAGTLLFTSAEGVPVITNGNPIQGVEVLVVPANGEPAAAAPAPTDGLTGTQWSAILFNNGASSIVSVQGVQITAEFGLDGQVSGLSGCNSYSATYTLGAGSSIEIGPIASTMKACSEPANVMEQESQYLAALQSAATYQVQGTILELEDANGESAVQYEKVGP